MTINTAQIPLRQNSTLHHMLTSRLLLIGIIITSLILFRPVLIWFTLKMSLANGWLHLLAFAALLGLAGYRILQLKQQHNSQNHLLISRPPGFLPGLFIWLPAALLYLLNEALVGFHTLSAALCIVYCYGLAGHFIQAQLWRRLFLPMSLLILVLPFEHYLDIYLGFPLRLLSAQWAGSVLQHTGLPLLTTESILVIDSRAAIVDLDCSGIKSLWVGLIFYLLLTWIESYKTNLRWLAGGLLFVLMLIIANVMRIIILIALDLILGLPEMAALIHQTLGLLGFGISSVLIWLFMRYACDTNPPHSPTESAIKSDEQCTPNTASLLRMGGLLLIINTLALNYQPLRAQEQSSPAPRTLELPEAFDLQTTDLNPQEQEFFASNQALAQKYRFTLPATTTTTSLTGSMVLVRSRAWKTHHVPENCYLSQGYSISEQGVWQTEPADTSLVATPAPNKSSAPVTLRYLQLTHSTADKLTAPTSPGISAPKTFKTGVYWFQSANLQTPDYSARVIDNLFHPGREWVMTSILWDQPVEPAQITPFILNLQQAIREQFHDL